MSQFISEEKISAWVALLRSPQQLLGQVEADLKQAGLPPLAWYDVLLELKRAPEGRLRLNEIGARMLLEKSNLSRLVDRLEREALLEREICEEDRRGAYAAITPAGRALQKRMWPVYARAIDTHFACHLSEGEAAELRRLLGKVLG
jgi:DNA-binding MarR family transcriptional regulator